MSTNARRQWLIAISVMLNGCLLCLAQEERPQYFNHLVQPMGWKIPRHGKEEIASKECSHAPILGVDAQCLRVTENFYIPTYFSIKSRLVLSSQKVSTSGLLELRYKNHVFGYTALVFGVDTASSRRVWWFDQDGNGKFTDLSSEPDFPGLPEWLHP